MTRWKLSLRLLCFLTTIVSVASARPVVASAAAQKSHASAEAGAEKHDHGADRVGRADHLGGEPLHPAGRLTSGFGLTIDGFGRLKNGRERLPGLIGAASALLSVPMLMIRGLLMPKCSVVPAPVAPSTPVPCASSM